MIIVKDSASITLEWSVYKGASDILEDFSRSLLKVFLLGRKDKFPLSYELVDKKIKVSLPENLPVDSYDIEAIWIKNPHRTPTRINDWCLQRARVDDVIGVTDSYSEVTHSGKNTLKIKSRVANYGYDGLNAYDLCVLSGKWGGSFSQWIESKLGQMINSDEIADGAVNHNKLADSSVGSNNIMAGAISIAMLADEVMNLIAKGSGGSGQSVAVVDNLISTDATSALSANQGRELSTRDIKSAVIARTTIKLVNAQGDTIVLLPAASMLEAGLMTSAHVTKLTELENRIRTLETNPVKSDDVITWDQLTSVNLGDDITLTATSQSGLPVTFKNTSGQVLTKVPTSIAMRYTIIASTAGNDNYNPASVTKVFNIANPASRIKAYYGASNALPSAVTEGTEVEFLDGNTTMFRSQAGKKYVWVAVPTGHSVKSWINILDSTEDLITLDGGSNITQDTTLLTGYKVYYLMSAGPLIIANNYDITIQ